jgi:hypothetical protein
MDILFAVLVEKDFVYSRQLAFAAVPLALRVKYVLRVSF